MTKWGGGGGGGSWWCGWEELAFSSPTSYKYNYDGTKSSLFPFFPKYMYTHVCENWDEVMHCLNFSLLLLFFLGIYISKIRTIRLHMLFLLNTPKSYSATQKKKKKNLNLCYVYIIYHMDFCVKYIYIYIYINIIVLLIQKLMFYHLCIIYYIKKLKCNYFTNEIIIDYIDSLYFMFATNIYNNQSDTPLTFMVGSIH